MRTIVLKPLILFHDFQLLDLRLDLRYYVLPHSLLGWCCTSGWVKGYLERPIRSRHDDNSRFTWWSGLHCNIFLFCLLHFWTWHFLSSNGCLFLQIIVLIYCVKYLSKLEFFFYLVQCVCFPNVKFVFGRAFSGLSYDINTYVSIW